MTEETHEEDRNSFWDKYGPAIFLTVMIGYLLLLATGVIAEVFKIQSILDWWIWTPPGSR